LPSEVLSQALENSLAANVLQVSTWGFCK
jgi:hypothetical protein